MRAPLDLISERLKPSSMTESRCLSRQHRQWVTPTSPLRSRGQNPFMACLAANRDAANLQAERGVDDLLHDVAIGSVDGGRSNDTDAQTEATVPMTMMAMMPGGSGCGGQSGGADYSGCTEGESDLAEHGGSPRGLVLRGMWSSHPAHGSRRPAEG